MNQILLASLSVVCYLAGALAISWRLFGRGRPPTPPRALGIALGLAGLVLHGLLLYQQIAIDGGLNLSFFNALSSICRSVCCRTTRRLR